LEGKYEDGLTAAKKALEVAERERGPRHPIVAAALNRSGELYRALGQYSAAEPLYKRAPDIRVKALGEGYPDVAVTRDLLAKLRSPKPGA